QGNLGHAREDDTGSAGPLLAIAPADAERRSLEDTVVKAGWNFVAVDKWPDGLKLLNTRAFPVVLYDRDLPGADWRAAIRAIISSRNPACVILASRVADTYLWEEVIQHGGFDILPKPFQQEQLLRTLRFALYHWRTGWTRRWHDG
ncbi:MAG: response regulator, partial [Acidobacteria bacterium]|nr:response regulator [Acidobacteriota bacterium]